MFKKFNNNKTKPANILSFLLCFSLAIEPHAFAQEKAEETYWLFPGDILPGKKAILPMTVGTGAGYDISLAKRDWFLLEPVQSVYSFQAKNLGSESGSLGYIGPKLNSYNAQMYYRLATGMILKETLKQMGLSSLKARRYFDSAAEKGLDFDKASLKEIGELPAVLQNLYLNFNRPVARHALLPYLIAPLAIADHQSSFRHFLETKNRSSFKEMCTNIEDMKPVVWVQDEIALKQNEINDLDRAYLDSVALLKQSSLEKVRLTGLLKSVTEETNQKTLCLNTLKNRVNKGESLPQGDCLATLEAVMAETNNQKAFEKFKVENLLNEEGDFVSQQKKKILLEETEAKISKKEQTEILKTKRLEDVQAALSEDKESLALLKAEEAAQKIESDRLDKVYASNKKELSELQQLSFDLDQGRFQAENSEEKTLKAIADTSTRESKISGLKALLPNLLEQKSRVQTAREALDTQINFLSQQIGKLELQVEAFKNTAVAEEVEQSMEELLTEKAKRAEDYKISLDKFRFSEYVISLFSQKVFSLESEKNSLFSKLENEKTAHTEYELKASELKSIRTEKVAEKQLELDGLSDQVSAYTSKDAMGWYLKQACKEETSSSVFLSRSTIGEQSFETASSSKNGKWGLFNLDYNDYKNSLDRGLALNLPSYISFSVRKIIKHNDFMNQSLFSSSAKCDQLSSDFSKASVDQIVGAFSMWTGGPQSNSENKGFCDLRAPEAQEFEKSLLGLTLFKGSLLDQVLPEVGVHSKEITLEREALYWLTNEFQIMTQGKRGQDIESRREGLIKSLIRVLANDYNSEFREEESDKEDSLNIQLATDAPGAELYRAANLPVGSTQTVKTIGKVSLYSAPLSEREYETGVKLSLNDKVEILPISDSAPDVAVKAKWVRVRLKSPRFGTTDQDFWMPAWPLTYGQFVSATGEPIFKFSKDMHCPIKRLVEKMDNFKGNGDGQVTRLLPEIKVRSFHSGLWGMSWKENKKTRPARTKSRTYVACEAFSLEGKKAARLKEGNPYLSYKGLDYSDIQGLRILEVKKITDVNGKEFYVPVEEYGGFAHAWILSRNSQVPRIILGEALDKDWSVVK